jgi:hypothetical protein
VIFHQKNPDKPATHNSEVKMKEQKRTAARTKSKSAASRSDKSEILMDVARAQDPARITQEARKQWEDSLRHQHSARLDRIYADLAKLLDNPALHDEAHWKTVKGYVDLIKWKFHLPRMYTFHPRGSVPSGSRHKGYNEDYYSLKYYTPKEGQSVAPGASGFGAFNPQTGVFQIVAVSTGNQVQVLVGPTVTVETDASADAVISAHTLIDWQYNLSSSANPAFVPNPPWSGTGEVDVEVTLLPRVSCINKTTGATLPTVSGPFGAKSLRNLTLKFDLQQTPWTTPSGHEIRVGRSDHDSAVALPVTFEPTVELPANARCDISIVTYVKSFASGGKGDKPYMFLGFGDVRAAGQFISIDVDLYS